MSLAQLIVLALPLVASLFTSIVSQDHLPDQANALIAIGVLILAATGTAFLGGHLTGNVATDILYVATVFAGLQNIQQFKPLFNWLQTHTPIAKPPVPATVQPIVPTEPVVTLVPPVIDQTNTSAAKPAN